MGRSRYTEGRRRPIGIDRIARSLRVHRRDRDLRAAIADGLLEYDDHIIFLRPRKLRLPWMSAWDYRSGIAGRHIAQSFELRPRRLRKYHWRYLPGSPTKFARTAKAFTVTGRWVGFWGIRPDGSWVFRAVKPDPADPGPPGGELMRVPSYLR